jgi:hypothetical protein
VTELSGRQRVISQGIRVAAVTRCFGTCRFSQQRELSMSARPLSELAILAELALASTPRNAMDPTVAQATGQVLSNRSSSSVNDAQRGGGSGELLGSIFGCAASGTSQMIGTIARGGQPGVFSATGSRDRAAGRSGRSSAAPRVRRPARQLAASCNKTTESVPSA